jgi:hypothetical protein
LSFDCEESFEPYCCVIHCGIVLPCENTEWEKDCEVDERRSDSENVAGD